MKITLDQAKKQYASHYNQAMFDSNESLAKILDPMTMLEFDQWFLQLSLNDGEITHTLAKQIHKKDVTSFYDYASDVLFGKKLNHKCLTEKLDQLTKFKSKHIIIDNNAYYIIKTINVLSVTDGNIDNDEINKAYLVENNGIKSLIICQFGNYIITDVTFLNNLITQYQQAIADTQDFIDQLNVVEE